MKDTYQITSLYFDTDQFDVFHRKGSYGRSKYRIRRYGQGNLVFLERKLKTKGLVSKRRSSVEISELAQLTKNEPERTWIGHWYQKRLEARKLKPICQITYHRTARVQMTSLGPIRLTLDDNIQAIPIDRIGFQDRSSRDSFLKEQVILELKYRREMPELFKTLISEFAIEQQRISKYRLGVKSLGVVPQKAGDTDINKEEVCLSF